MEVKGHLGSTEVKLWKPCKHNISRREAWTDLIYWYVGVPHWVQGAYCFLWRSKVIWGQNCKNLVKHNSRNREAWTDLIFGMLMYLIEYKKPIVFGGGQRSFGIIRGQNCKNLVKHNFSRQWSLDRSYAWYVGVSHWVQEAYCFWWRPNVIWGQQGSKLWKPCKHDISRREAWDRSHIWYVGVLHWVKEA